MRKIVTIVLLAALTGCAGSVKKAPAPEPALKTITFHNCYDGDTCNVTIEGVMPIFGRRIGVRLRGIDTPEIRGKCDREKLLALAARDRTRQLIFGAQNVRIDDIGRGKYFRIVARIIADGRDVSKVLIAEGHAVPYDGKKKTKDWCATTEKKPVAKKRKKARSKKGKAKP